MIWLLGAATVVYFFLGDTFDATVCAVAILPIGIVDIVIEVRTEAAHEMVRALGRKEGLFVGISSGAAMFGALQVAEELSHGTVVAIFPDAGYKYLSDRALWEGQ